MIRVLIVDDEPLARETVQLSLAADPEIAVVGACSGADAEALVARTRPDMMFLDVQMPEVGGFDLVEAIGPGAVPVIVFVTAYDQYALKAFEVHALDYLLKPFDRERFAATLDRARAAVQLRANGALDAGLSALLAEFAARRRSADRLLVRAGGKERLIPVEEVDWFEAAGNYVRLHVGRERHLLRETMCHLEERLDAERFVRIHRSSIVNLARVQEMEPYFHGDYIVRLKDGRTLTLSRTYRSRLLSRLAAQA